METEKRISQPETPPAEAILTPEPPKYRGLRWAFMGDQGLRAGWSVALFIVLTLLFLRTLGLAASVIFRNHPHAGTSSFSPYRAIIGEVIEVLACLGAGAVVALIEHRRVMDYNLTGPRRLVHFFSGLVAGFAALSALVGALAWGGWIRFGPIELSGARIFSFGALWAVAFLLTGLGEEGGFRCFLQFTLARGINFWWALGAVGGLCLDLLLRGSGNGIWGVYFAALLGLAPCLWLHLKNVEGSNFWQAAWVTSTLFAFVHTGNGGENWIGIFAAAAIGFVFCVSIRLTGSAWWAIGCHAAWDWAETLFLRHCGQRQGGRKTTYLSTSPAGSVLWSGGADGPEGSLLVLGILALLLAALIVLYGRKGTSTVSSAQKAV
jgi:hypothetical protein